MKKNILSLIVGATLVLPTMAMAAPVNNSDLMPADMRNTPVESTVQAEIEGPDGELLATQPGAVDVKASNTADVDMDMDNEADETDDMDNEASDDNAALMNNAQATTNAAAMTTATTVQAPVQNAQAPNMQHSNADYQPLIAGEAATENKVADAASTLQEKKKDKRGELLATQSANVQFKENRRIAVSR